MPLAPAISFTVLYDKMIAAFSNASVSANVFKKITSLAIRKVTIKDGNSVFFFRFPKNLLDFLFQIMVTYKKR